MKKIFFALWIGSLAVPATSAQDDRNGIRPDMTSYSVLSTDSAYEAIGLIPEVMDENVKTLLQSWHAQYFSQTERHCLDDNENVYFADETYRDRLARIPSIIPLDYNPVVRNCISLYADRRRDLVRYMMGMADLYFPIFEQILDQYHLPLELKYLAVVESALNPRALSRVGAAGLWQFMLPTGKLYGLEINSLIDERLDPYASTHAACRYFKDMYATFGDWHLVLASYNCGPGNVNKAIRRAGGRTNFWDIFPYLPKETRSYVPLFIAATYIMTYHCEHNLCPMQTSLSVASDTVMVRKMLHLQQVSDLLKVDMELLKTFNPQYKREIIPGNIRPSVLKLPVQATYAYLDHQDTINLHRAEELLGNNLSGGEPSAAANEVVNSTQEIIKHTVESGENLYIIANRYGVTAQNIRKWNRLKSNRVPHGKRLVIHVDNGGVRYGTETQQEISNLAATVSTGSQTTASSSSTAKPQTQKRSMKSQKGYVSYKVRSGDSLMKIARKYPGVTVTQIQSANRLKNSTIHAGQILKIPVG